MAIVVHCLSQINSCGIYPIMKGEDMTMHYMLAWPSLATNVRSENEEFAYDLQVRQFHIDGALPEATKVQVQPGWTLGVSSSGKYPTLFKMVSALLSCFRGPQVEGSFSKMSNLVNTSTALVNVATYNSIQIVKYSLMSKEKSSVDYFENNDFLHDPVDGKLALNMRSANKHHSQQLAQERASKEAKIVKLKLSNTIPVI